jgi:hypothetical protein
MAIGAPRPVTTRVCLDESQRSQRSQLATFTRTEATSAGRRQDADLRFCVELRGIEPLTSSMPCTRRTVSAVQRRPAEATRVRSYPSGRRRQDRSGKTSTIQCVRIRPAPSLAVPRPRRSRMATLLATSTRVQARQPTAGPPPLETPSVPRWASRRRLRADRCRRSAPHLRGAATT